MVTMSSGTEMPMMAGRLKVGVVQTGPESSSPIRGAVPAPEARTSSTPMQRASRTAYFGMNRRPSR